jgi:hypothetical protein
METGGRLKLHAGIISRESRLLATTHEIREADPMSELVRQGLRYAMFAWWRRERGRISGGMAMVRETHMIEGLRRALSRAVGGVILGFALVGAPVSPTQAAYGVKEFSATLGAAERKAFETYIAAKTTYDFKLDAYWREVSDKRALRRGKKGRSEALGADDYVRTFPSVYDGPELAPDLAKRWAAFQAKEEETRKEPRKPVPGLDDFLAQASANYNFIPERIPEREFKLRYAREALRLGLTKDQVVRVYALETSGLGTAEMVAGIHPIKKTGSPISTAIGYAQLLAANSTDELVQHGGKFLDRLSQMAKARDIAPDRRAVLITKADVLKKMLSAARSVPHKWDSHVAFARTPKGLGIHSINLDGDIGPWLQVVKLNGLKEMADRAGLAKLKGAEIELMNLAGPATGLEMMRPAARDAPTPNFFERGAYGRNTIVRGKTAAELMAALDKRMDDNIGNAGAIEFAQVFDEVATEYHAAQ